MLTLTDSARVAINGILAGAPSPETAGLRIAESSVKPGALDLTIAATPADGDAVVEHDGARVFLDDRVAHVLEHRILDANASPTGSVEFRIANTA